MRLTALTDGPACLITPLLNWGAHLLLVLRATGRAVSPPAGGRVRPMSWPVRGRVAMPPALSAARQYRHLRTRPDRDAAPWDGVRSLVPKADPLIRLVALSALPWATLSLVFTPPCA